MSSLRWDNEAFPDRWTVDVVVQRPPTMTGYPRHVFDAFGLTIREFVVRAQVNEGDTQIINIRETDERLGPLVFVLIVLGVVTLVATVVFWWLTSPRRSARVVRQKSVD